VNEQQQVRRRISAPKDSAEPRKASFHHIGYVVKSIEDSASNLISVLDLSWDRRIIHDPLQGVLVAFFECVNRRNPTVELVEPVGSESPVYRFLQRGGGLHHLCYEVDSLDTHLQLMKANRALIVREPLPAVAFNGRRIAWVYSKDKLLLEFLER
jgi:methylmalonyl-CoA/ethylmalonyl-CoA epimerase